MLSVSNTESQGQSLRHYNQESSLPSRVIRLIVGSVTKNVLALPVKKQKANRTVKNGSDGWAVEKSSYPLLAHLN